MFRVLEKRAASASSLVSSPRNSAASSGIDDSVRCFSAGVLLDGVDRNSDAFAKNSTLMEGFLSRLQSHVNKVLAGGGIEAVRRNRSRNKLLPRERINCLLDRVLPSLSCLS
ncbi:hypothetical protein SLE2022_261210 [Rubroshorea leprosula]